MSLNESSLEKKLNHCANTQDSIQSLSLWILHHRNHHKRIIELWLKALERAKVSHRLTLFYLANDVVQHARKKNIVQYVSDFETVLREAIVFVRDEKIRHNVNRVLNIWQERNIYPSEFVDELRALLTGVSGAKAARASKIVAEFKLSNVIDKIKRVKRLENVTRQRIESVNEANIDKLSKEVLNNLKDKTHGEQFSKDFDEATKHIEAAVAALEKEIAARNDLIEILEKTEIFYETQKGEAKIVATAYKNFASRVKSVKKKLGESKTSLPSPLPSPCADAPSPTNSDDGPQLPGSEVLHQNGKEVSSLDKRLSNLMQGIPMVPNEVNSSKISESSYKPKTNPPLPPALQAAIGTQPDLWLQQTLQPPPPPPPPPIPVLPPNLGGMAETSQVYSEAARSYAPYCQPPPPPPPPPIPNIGPPSGHPLGMMSQDAFYSGAAYEYEYNHQLNPGIDISDGGDKVQPIQAVISSRDNPQEPFKVAPIVNTSIYEGCLDSSNQQPHENFEPADMELGDSDDDDPAMRLQNQNQRFLKVIETRPAQNEPVVSSSSSFDNSSQLIDGHSNHDTSHLSPHNRSPRRKLSPRPLNRNYPSSRHQYHHPGRGGRNFHDVDSRWSNSSRQPSHHSGPSMNQYSQNTGRQWKTSQSHSSRGSYNRRY